MGNATTTPHGPARKIESIHILRGITIAVIVFRHCLFLFDSQGMNTSLLAQVVDEFFFNWTIFFVLISGYLFQHLSDKYETRRYWTSKIKNIICPYIIVSLAIFPLLHYETIQSLPLYALEGECLSTWILRMLVSGQHSEPLWYIPMISVIYLMGPILYRLSLKDLTVPAILGLMWTIITYKPEPWNAFLNVLHYLPVYIVGMFVRQKHEEIILLIRKNLVVLSGFFLILICVSFHEKYEVYAINQSGGYLMSIENIVLFVLFFYALERWRWPAWVKKAASYLANISLAIYLIHMVIVHKLLVMLTTLPWWPAVTSSSSGVFSTFANAAFTLGILLLCAGTVELIRLVAGKRSRMLVGA